MKKINAFVLIAVAIMAFAFIACGGEEPKDPVDDTVITDDAIVTDDTTDNDGLIDNEPTDNDSTLVTCEQDENCKQKCGEFLYYEGTSTILEPESAAGQKVTMTLSVAADNTNCDILISEKWSFKWTGKTLQDLGWAEDTITGRFFSLSGTEEEKIVIDRKILLEDPTPDLTYKLQKDN